VHSLRSYEWWCKIQKMGWFGVTQGHRQCHHSVQSAYDFLYIVLDFNRNYASILYRFLLRCSQLFVESRRCQTTHLHLAPPSNFASAEKCSPWAIVWRCLRDSMFSGFCTIPACDRRTDEQTDGLTSDTVTAYGASIASLGKNRIAGTYDCQLVVY